MKNQETKTAARLSLQCKRCKKNTVFEQPYPYHAGFADQGFLYNDAGNLTFVWSSYDPVFGKHFSGSPWILDAANQKKFEDSLPPSPNGDRWRFSNLPRCPHCREPIGGSIEHSIYYFVYPGSVVTDGNGVHRLGDYLKKNPTDEQPSSS